MTLPQLYFPRVTQQSRWEGIPSRHAHKYTHIYTQPTEQNNTKRHTQHSNTNSTDSFILFSLSDEDEDLLVGIYTRVYIGAVWIPPPSRLRVLPVAAPGFQYPLHHRVPWATVIVQRNKPKQGTIGALQSTVVPLHSILCVEIKFFSHILTRIYRIVLIIF